MSDDAGPLAVLQVNGVDAPFFVIQFDKDGTCKAPKTRAAFLSELKQGGYTHLFFFSHGWNNDWAYATERYLRFVKEFHSLTARYPGRLANYKPLFVGVFWPSISLLLPWEEPPNPAAAGGAVDQEVADFAMLFTPDEAERVREIAGQGNTINVDQARALADIVAPKLGSQDDITDRPAGAAISSKELLEMWRSTPSPHRTTNPGSGMEEPDPGLVQGHAGAPAATPAQPAGLAEYLDPRWLIRLATVRIMKDRARVVGSEGVSALLADCIARGAQVHGIGHSYGAMVLLSALRGLKSGKVSSILLLQPAVSYLSFAKDNGEGVPGGFSGLADRVASPVFATFSANDFPLTRIYHLALRRAADLGDIPRPAAVVPSRYAALGGYGPPNVRNEMEIQTLPAVGKPFTKPTGTPRIVGFESTAAIAGHGEVLNEPVYWALLQQVAPA